MAFSPDTKPAPCIMKDKRHGKRSEEVEPGNKEAEEKRSRQAEGRRFRGQPAAEGQHGTFEEILIKPKYSWPFPRFDIFPGTNRAQIAVSFRDGRRLTLTNSGFVRKVWPVVSGRPGLE